MNGGVYSEKRGKRSKSEHNRKADIIISMALPAQQDHTSCRLTPSDLEHKRGTHEKERTTRTFTKKMKFFQVRKCKFKQRFSLLLKKKKKRRFKASGKN